MHNAYSSKSAQCENILIEISDIHTRPATRNDYGHNDVLLDQCFFKLMK